MSRSRKSGSKIKQARKWLSGALPAGALVREDSDDELGYDDLPWEWIYDNDIDEHISKTSGHKKQKQSGTLGIVGARMGNFLCRVGDTVLLKAADNEAWVGLICDFNEDEEGKKNASFMWFSSPAEIRNKTKKRADFLQVFNTFV